MEVLERVVIPKIGDVGEEVVDGRPSTDGLKLAHHFVAGGGIVEADLVEAQVCEPHAHAGDGQEVGPSTDLRARGGAGEELREAVPGVVDDMYTVAVAGQLGNLRTAIRWGADFLLRAHTSPTTLYTQGGDGNADNKCWERPEDMDTLRTVYKITVDSPGSEAAGEAVAALAAAYMVFKDDSNKTFATQLLTSSRSLFDFANNYRGSFQSSCPFYCSYSGFMVHKIGHAA